MSTGEVKSEIFMDKRLYCQQIECYCPFCGNPVKFVVAPSDINWESMFRELEKQYNKLREKLYEASIEMDELRGNRPPRQPPSMRY